jgi:excisionase family DNA binding protein
MSEWAIPEGLRFPAARRMLYVFEVADKLECSKQHVVNLIEEGKMGAVDLGKAGRRFLRVPLESYYEFLRSRNSQDNSL